MKEGQGGRGCRNGRRAAVSRWWRPRSLGGIEVARYPTLEQAEWRARQLAAEAERSPRGYVQYLVKPIEARKDRG